MRDELWAAATTHPSAGGRDFYRLAFLGDGILEAYIRIKLIEENPRIRTGDAAKIRSQIASTKALARVARAWGLDRAIRLSGEPAEYILASAVEAVIGGLYQQYGFYGTYVLLSRHFWPMKEELVGLCTSYKELLREKLGQGNFFFLKIEKTGPKHRPHYKVALVIGGKRVAVGEGRNVHEAQEAAARAYLEERGLIGKGN